jgi:hypothetical protein
MSIEKKLGVWGKDKIVNSEGKFLAKDYYCVRCYSDKKEVGAEIFWPAMELDIKSFPCCKSCVDYLKLKVLFGSDFE